MNTELVISLKGNRTTRSSWLRYRLSKYFYEGETFTPQEYEYLLYLILDLAEAKNEQLPKKMQNRVLILNWILNNSFQLMQKLEEKELKMFSFYVGDLKLTPHEYYGLKYGYFKQDEPVSNLYSIKRLEKKRYPEQRRIGVGYRDKGSAQIEAINGAPKWQYTAQFTEETHEKAKKYSLARLLTESSELTSELEDEIEDFFLDF